MTPFEVAAVGDNCIDKFMPPAAVSAVGGNAVNVAVHLHKHGLRTAYFGAVGPDADGDRMIDCFRQNGLMLDHLQTLPGVTAYTDIAIDPHGDRIFLFEEFGVCRDYRPTAQDIETLCRLRHVHIGWLNDGGALRRTLVAAGISVSQDISVNPGADGLAIAFASAGSEPDAAAEKAAALLAEGAKLAVVTRGALGSLASNGAETLFMDIKPVDVVDTTGAGDTFIAAFIAAHLEGRPLAACLEAGRDAAAIACTHFGGFPQTALPLT